HLTLHIWRQKSPRGPGRTVPYRRDGVSPDIAGLDALDTLNERPTPQREDPPADDHERREGPGGTCAMMITGLAHGPERAATACPAASAMRFLSAKVSHLARLPQGQAERKERVRAMVSRHDREGFGHCTNINECEAACPKEISVVHIAQLNRDFIRSTCGTVIK